MKLRAYFWEDRIISKLQFRLRRALRASPYNHFVVGNAGDILARALIEDLYGYTALNDAKRGSRMLLVGSIGHRIMNGDLLCGVGVKTREVPKASRVAVRVWGVRGPISYDVFKAAGHDVSDVRYQMDPGLLLRFQLENLSRIIQPQGVVFIPHYRERAPYMAGLPQGIRLVDIDDHPLAVGRRILEAELVYASSLHGVIFAHALGRPCVLVAPQTAEPMLKYEDYFASVNLDMPRPLGSIYDANFASAPNSPAHVPYRQSDFQWPDASLLAERGILVP